MIPVVSTLDVPKQDFQHFRQKVLSKTSKLRSLTFYFQIAQFQQKSVSKREMVAISMER